MNQDTFTANTTTMGSAAGAGPGQATQINFFGIGYGIPFSFLGISISLVAFTVIIVFIASIKDIVDSQDIVW